MTLENISIFVTIALVILMVVFIFKKAVKLAVAVGCILLLFNVGFMMNGTELRSFFNLDDYVSTEDAEYVENAFNDFDKKREEYGVIDPDQVYDGMLDAVAKGTSILIEGIGRVDIVKFASTVSDRLLNAGVTEVNREELEETIRNQLQGISDSDLDKILDLIEENMEAGGGSVTDSEEQPADTETME
jgi:hypothetical protein